MTRFGMLVEEIKGKIHRVQDALGRKLFDDYRADVINAWEGEIRAAVDDDRHRYKLKISWGASGFEFNCACGTDPSRVCAHVWAAVLTAREDGYFGDYIDDGDDDDDYGAGGATYTNLGFAGGTGGGYGGAAAAAAAKEAKPPRWKTALAQLTGTAAPAVAPLARDVWPETKQVAYVVEREETLLGKGLVVEISYREPKRNGEMSKPKPAKIAKADIARLPREADRLIVAMLAGGERADYGYYYGTDGASKYRLNEALARVAVPLMARSGQLFLRSKHLGGTAELTPLAWVDERPWEVKVDVKAEGEEYVVAGVLERGNEQRPLAMPLLLTTGGLVFWRDAVEPLDDGGAFNWVSYLREHGSLRVPRAEAGELARQIYSAGVVPGLRLAEELKLEEVREQPSIHLKLAPPDRKFDYDDRLRAEVAFEYDGERVTDAGRSIVQPERKRVIVRDAAREAQAHARLYQLGFRDVYNYRTAKNVLGLTPSKLAKTVAALVKEGWHVQAEGKLYRQPGEFKIEVNSGIDWFELHGSVQFGDQVATLPQLLAAVRKGESLVQLGDGTVGMLPEEWLKKYGMLAGMGKEEGDHLQFTRSQAGLLDALLAAQPEATCDEVFEQTRRMLRNFEGITAAEAPATFTGELRPYQKDGLGWLGFLQKFGFGGCLADDMGLGKTIQVLAMLEAKRIETEKGKNIETEKGGNGETEKKKGRKAAAPPVADSPVHPVSGSSSSSPRPSLVVVPRSLVFNWQAEARKFAPQLKILDHSHHARLKAGEHLADYDVVLTTYGTLRNDAAYLKDVEFDHVILDEAQAIKNAASESAKAARLLKARHRLALSGTPVQNHLGDLWSLFDFLNPGMLGGSSVLNGASGLTKAIDQDTRVVLARALRPFILRRTKEQVAKDLPEKLEQTIYCELGSKQRKAYDELKEFYRANLLDLVAKHGIAKAKIQILEALLRLRQAACHPGLIDKAKVGENSAKLDTLMPRLTEIAEEGHKALVFSQFTSFLSIVKKRLDAEKVKYEYLDGKTRDRQARVDQFQSDPNCKLFLISLKAGGVGLNLTSADYVFLLDPWWNPAVEAQAIDRTHRIGQTRQVFACRLIAKDTVEEKVLELQKSKRALADAIIGQDNSVISSLGRSELELLLS